MRKRLAILGSTGSIGTQTLEVIGKNPGLFEVIALTANNNVHLLADQIRQFRPEVAVIGNEDKYSTLKELLPESPSRLMPVPKPLKLLPEWMALTW